MFRSNDGPGESFRGSIKISLVAWLQCDTQAVFRNGNCLTIRAELGTCKRLKFRLLEWPKALSQSFCSPKYSLHINNMIISYYDIMQCIKTLY